MLRIGKFARLAQVSVKTLRHYEKIGLLVPSMTDPENGYRLYEIDQLADMMRIMALRDCGFGLNQINHLLQTHDDQAISTLLEQRIADQQQVIRKEETRLQRLKARHVQLSERVAGASHDFVLKRTEAYTLVGRREVVAGQAALASFVQAVLHDLAQQLVAHEEPFVHLYFDFEPSKIDLFVGSPVLALPQSLADLNCQRISAGIEVASVLHRGEYATIQQTGDALAAWIHQSGYQISGPLIEIYHRSPAHTARSSDYLTELQFPISDTNLDD